MALNLTGLIGRGKELVQGVSEQFRALGGLPHQIQRTQESVKAAKSVGLKLDGLMKSPAQVQSIPFVNPNVMTAASTPAMVPSQFDVVSPTVRLPGRKETIPRLPNFLGLAEELAFRLPELPVQILTSLAQNAYLT